MKDGPGSPQWGEKLLTKKMFEKKRILLTIIYHLVLKLDLDCCVSQCSDAVANTQEQQFKDGQGDFTPKISAHGHFFLPFLGCGKTEHHDGSKW